MSWRAAIDPMRCGRAPVLVPPRFGIRLAGLLCAALVVFLLAACAGSVPRLEDPTSVDLSPRHAAKKRLAAGGSGRADAGRGRYDLYPGEDAASPKEPAPPRSGGVTASGDGFLINIDGASIPEAAKLILGDTLKENYIVDPQVEGTITLSTVKRLTAKETLSAFEAALRINGAVLIKDGERYRITVLTNVAEGEMGSADLGSRGGEATPGFGISVVPLRNVGATAMMELIDNFITRNGTVRASTSGNLLLLRGTAYDRQALADIVLSFDVDWMKGQSAGIVTLANSSPDDIVTQLEAVYGADNSAQGVRFVALDRLNAVLLLANSRDKVRRAVAWAARLDRPSTEGVNHYVYTVQNGKARDVAQVLNATFKEDNGGPETPSDVAPGEDTFQTQTSDASTAGNDAGAGQSGEGGKGDKLDAEGSAPPDKSAEVATFEAGPGVRITASASNNTLVIRATQRDYRKILAILHQIDKPGVQVVINTTIAEVVLNDTLRYGVQAYFKSRDTSGGIFEGNSLVLRPSFPGLNFLFGSTSDPRLVLDALAAITSVRVVSSPSVAVLENQPAVIKVGDQVPITTQQVIGTQDANAPIVNSVEYRDAGVILQVTPRVNEAGLVTMQVAQELSAVARTASGATTLTPTISQRSITSTVSVYSEQTVVLGGLISTQDTRSKDSVPGINRIPILGDLFGKTENTARRSELIVFITPKVVRNSEDASRVSQELRDKLRLFSP